MKRNKEKKIVKEFARSHVMLNNAKEHLTFVFTLPASSSKGEHN